MLRDDAHSYLEGEIAASHTLRDQLTQWGFVDLWQYGAVDDVDNLASLALSTEALEQTIQKLAPTVQAEGEGECSPQEAWFRALRSYAQAAKLWASVPEATDPQGGAWPVAALKYDLEQIQSECL